VHARTHAQAVSAFVHRLADVGTATQQKSLDRVAGIAARFASLTVDEIMAGGASELMAELQEMRRAAPDRAVADECARLLFTLAPCSRIAEYARDLDRNAEKSMMETSHHLESCRSEPRVLQVVSLAITPSPWHTQSSQSTLVRPYTQEMLDWHLRQHLCAHKTHSRWA
jgi:hypothetical protein